MNTIEGSSKSRRGMLSAVAVSVFICFGQPALAIQAESQAEKAANLERQAKGGLFNQWTFDKQAVDEAPAGFARMGLGNGAAAVWKVAAESTAPSLPNILTASSPCAAPACYQLLVASGLEYEYPDLNVRLRALTDGVAAKGGTVFALKDSENFYAAVVDFAGRSLEVVRVVDGKETVLGRAPVTLKNVPWHSLRVQRNTNISKDFIEAFVDGALTLSVEDQTLGLGQVGLLLKGQGVLQFDSFHAVPLFSNRPFSPPAAY